MLERLIFLVIGGLIAHLWQRWRERMTKIRWWAQYQHLAIAAQHHQFGTVQVLYNGVPARNLYVGILTLQNTSDRDLQDVTLNVTVPDDGLLLSMQGVVEDSVQQLPLTDEYLEWHGRYLAEQDQQARERQEQFLMRRRDFHVPVLNRRTTAQFMALLHQDEPAQPNLRLTCDHPGVKLELRPPAELQFFGESRQRVVLTGFLISLGATLVVLTALDATPLVWGLVLGAWLLALLSPFPGVAVLKLGKLLRRLMG